MIKVGDKFTGIYGRKEVVTSIWLNDKTVGVESGLAYSYEEVYKSWYEQQKQRADELEKRWNILRDRLIEIYKNDTETGKQYLRSFLCLLDELEGKENIFETVQNLEN